MDMKTSYLGLELPHPIIASASPLSATLDGVLELADAGAAAVVMSSIYEEQIQAEEMTEAFLSRQGADSQPEADSYFPALLDAPSVLEGRLEMLRKAAERAGIPIIASLNGTDVGGWVDFAGKLEQAGAAAIELNICDVPVDANLTGAEVEERCLQIVREVAASVKLPVAVKIPPFFSAPGNMARRIVAAGAKGVVLFNRFYESDIDLATLQAKPDLRLGTRGDIRQPLTWIGQISHGFGASIAASGGVQSGDEVVKYLLVGADAVMTTSALLLNGSGYLKTLIDGLRVWMEWRGFRSISALRGLLAVGRGAVHAEAYLRARYHAALMTGNPDAG